MSRLSSAAEYHPPATQVATLTNYTASFSQGVLGRAGLDALVDKPLDIGMVQRWKPHPATYKFAVKQLGLEPDQARRLQHSTLASLPQRRTSQEERALCHIA